MSHEYVANINRGDQSSNPFLQASFTAEITDPVTCDILLCSRQVWHQHENIYRKAWQTIRTALLLNSFAIDLNGLYEERHAFHGFGAQRALEGSDLKACFDVTIEIFR